MHNRQPSPQCISCTHCDCHNHMPEVHIYHPCLVEHSDEREFFLQFVVGGIEKHGGEWGLSSSLAYLQVQAGLTRRSQGRLLVTSAQVHLYTSAKQVH